MLDASGSLDDADHVLTGDAAGAEDVAVSEVLSGEVPDRERRQNDVSATIDYGIKLLVDEFPLSVDNRLILRGVGDPDLSVGLLSL